MKHYAIAVLLCVILSVSLFAAAESPELFDFSGTILYSQEEVVSNAVSVPAYENEAVLAYSSEQETVFYIDNMVTTINADHEAEKSIKEVLLIVVVG